MQGQTYQWILIFLLLSNSVKANDWQLLIEFSSMNQSDPIPVSGVYQDDWNYEFKGGEHIFSRSQISLGAELNHWQVYLHERNDYYLSFSEDTAEYFYLDKNKKPIPKNRNFEQYLNFNQIKATGIGAGYRWLWNNQIEASLRVNLWQPDFITYGTIKGNIQTLEDDSFDGELELDYSYSEDYIFVRQEQSFSGNGISIDAFLSYQINDSLNFSIYAKDLFNRFNWQEATYTQATVTSNTSGFDENGFVEFRPILSGVESERKVTQKLPSYYQISFEYQIKRNSLIVRYNRYFKTDIIKIGYRLSFEHSSFEWLVDVQNKSITSGLNFGKFSLNFTIDDIRVSQSHVLGLEFAWSY